MNLSRNRKTASLTALALCGTLSITGWVYGFVNEAISLALEGATPYVEQGFEVREDNWSGEVQPGKPLLIRHQLFRGNEYWFWAGTSWPRRWAARARTRTRRWRCCARWIPTPARGSGISPRTPTWRRTA